MTLPNKIQLYIGSESKDLETSMKRTGNKLSVEVRDRIRKSYEAERIIRNLLDALRGSDIPNTKLAEDYLK